jgi:hypothetical protein
MSGPALAGSERADHERTSETVRRSCEPCTASRAALSMRESLKILPVEAAGEPGTRIGTPGTPNRIYQH